MKQILIITTLLLLVAGCTTSESQKMIYQKNDEIKIIYDKKTSVSTLKFIYEDEQYKYFINEGNSYVEYKGNKLTYKESIEQKLITIEDLTKMDVKIFKEVRLTFNCNGISEALDCFYEDAINKYCFPVVGNYLDYGEIHYNFKDALEQKIITLNDIDEIIQYQEGCNYLKLNK